MPVYWLSLIAFALVLGGLLLYSGEPLLLAVLILVVLLPVIMGVLIRRDAKALHTELHVRPGGRDGKALPFAVTVRADRPLFVTRCLVAEIEIRNAMFAEAECLRFLLPVSGRETKYELPYTPQQCGRLTVGCRSLKVMDLLRLFSVPVESFPAVQTIIHPHRVQVQVELTRETVGSPRGEGLMLNRKGSDASEMFDIREYVPGDDVRTIHWKLSGKAGELIVRQPSDPSHYNIAMLPDFGLQADGKPTTAAERSAAAAYGAAVGAALVRQGVGFCMVLPGPGGLELCEVNTPREFQRLVGRWLSSPVPEHTGDGLRYFVTEHLDSHFTRLLLLTAGRYTPDLTKLDGRIGVTVLHAADSAAMQHLAISPTSETVTLPTAADTTEVCRLLC